MNDLYNATKIFLKLILKYYLKYITRLVLLIHKPLIIAVSGSTNVVFTKDEITRQLAEMGLGARSNPKNFNTEIGLPLAILGLPAGYSNFKDWPPIIWRAFKSIFYLKLPKILILGLGVSDPGDMKYLMSLVKPDIGVITDLTQRYLESFNDMDELAGEYEFFAKSIKTNGHLILNYDNPRIRKLAEIKKNKSGTFNKVPDKISFFSLDKNDIGARDHWHAEVIGKSLDGQTIRVNRNGNPTNHRVNRFGQHHIYSLLAGLIAKKVILEYRLTESGSSSQW